MLLALAAVEVICGLPTKLLMNFHSKIGLTRHSLQDITS